MILLTWFDLAVVLVNLSLGSSHETSVMETARTFAEHPTVILRRESAVGEDAAAPQGKPTEVVRNAALDENEFGRLVEAVFIEDRVRTRISALRQAVERLE